MCFVFAFLYGGVNFAVIAHLEPNLSFGIVGAKDYFVTMEKDGEVVYQRVIRADKNVSISDNLRHQENMSMKCLLR